MKSNRVSKASNQIPSTDEKMPDLFHSGKSSTDYMHENLHLNHVMPECQITDKVSK